MKNFLFLTTFFVPLISSSSKNVNLQSTLSANPTINVYANSASTIIFPTEPFQKGFQHLNSHKLKYIAAVCGVSYVIFTGRLLYIKHIMNDPKRWNNLYTGIPLKKLAEIPKETFYQQLNDEIAARYDIPNSNILMSVSQFFKETGHEIDLLKYYSSMGYWLSLFKINLPFFVTSTSIKNAQIKIKRLLYFRTIIANRLEPENSIRRLNLIDTYRNIIINACRKLRSWMPRALNRHQ
ncbi:TPA: hypothetical protein DIC20_01300 [Candidatus Dependentiae bacterium]|nr:MAG: hypothetical protein US03_C0002G0132 [candidate division TM6 bacterium GW2011_GWF2_36_131]KKQ03565.1 MAG: hypothetical protein US13_C0002G0131 [candidate division TM6 bacterium GW2011_GWE2_36_25]KKQ20159.1 MAG: hypothetical protein US32_C0001G0056 [candidate division TM6 bacterium GW2011_GWA2_36_9]HBR70701.1 hypothetical protein [Candidatus Dependentiae bacterium]HCU00321.1 hypothetical protein [Candidatus Dependentiae bacterium]